MGECSVCGAQDTQLRKCRYCKKRQCIDHLLPESHDCLGLKITKSTLKRVDGGTDDQSGKEDAYRTVEPVTMGTRPPKSEVFDDAGPDTAPDGSLVRSGQEPDSEENQNPVRTGLVPWLERKFRKYFS